MPPPVISALALFMCTPVAVYDGDGPIWCAEGPHVRISGIAAREMDDACRPGHPCPDASGDMPSILRSNRGTPSRDSRLRSA